MPFLSEAAFTEKLVSAFTERTRILFLSHITSPTAIVFPIAPVIAEAKKRGIWTVIDNTWATPLYQKPIELGIDVSVHAGTKYMDQLMARYFQDANFDAANRALFAFASYNAGPGNISKMRKEATKRGLNPDKWFNNVEMVTAEKIGIETTTYVRNIYKYYVAYKLLLDAHAVAEQARLQVAPAKP